MIEAQLARLTPSKDTMIAVGVFDSVHLGHQSLLRYLSKKAQDTGLGSAVITFEPRPQAVLNPQLSLQRLISPGERESLIRSLGIELVATLPFAAEVAKLSAREFLSLIKKHLRMQGLVIGPNFALGRNREGNSAKLEALGEEIGFKLDVIPPAVLNGQTISSTLIREALLSGNVELAMRFLGRSFKLTGNVIPGASRGRYLGFPTANLSVEKEQALPHDGVYATITHVSNKAFSSVTSIGSRPTFGGGERTIEVYLMDFNGDLYGNKLTVEFINRLREEQRFEHPEELKTQIEADIKKARELLAK